MLPEVNISSTRLSLPRTRPCVPFVSVHLRLQPSYGADFVPLLKKATLEKGLTFVGPSLAAEVAKGDMAAFTKLVQDTRAALAY